MLPGTPRRSIRAHPLPAIRAAMWAAAAWFLLVGAALAAAGDVRRLPPATNRTTGRRDGPPPTVEIVPPPTPARGRGQAPRPTHADPAMHPYPRHEFIRGSAADNRRLHHALGLAHMDEVDEYGIAKLEAPDPVRLIDVVHSANHLVLHPVHHLRHLDLNVSVEQKIHDASRTSTVDVLKRLLCAHPDANVDGYLDGSRWTALLWSAQRDKMRVTEFLLNHGASPNYVTPDARFSPLMAAAALGYTDAVQLLLDFCANVTLRSTAGGMAEDYGRRHPSVVKLLRTAREHPTTSAACRRPTPDPCPTTTRPPLATTTAAAATTTTAAAATTTTTTTAAPADNATTAAPGRRESTAAPVDVVPPPTPTRGQGRTNVTTAAPGRRESTAAPVDVVPPPTPTRGQGRTNVTNVTTAAPGRRESTAAPVDVVPPPTPTRGQGRTNVTNVTTPSTGAAQRRPSLSVNVAPVQAPTRGAGRSSTGTTVPNATAPTASPPVRGRGARPTVRVTPVDAPTRGVRRSAGAAPTRNTTRSFLRPE